MRAGRIDQSDQSNESSVIHVRPGGKEGQVLIRHAEVCIVGGGTSSVAEQLRGSMYRLTRLKSAGTSPIADLRRRAVRRHGRAP